MSTLNCTIPVLGGLSCTIEYTKAPADPSVGIFYSYAEDWAIIEIGDRSINPQVQQWLNKRLQGPKGYLLEGLVNDYAAFGG